VQAPAIPRQGAKQTSLHKSGPARIACGVSEPDKSAHALVRRAVTHPDVVERLARWVVGEGELHLDQVAPAAHGFVLATLCEAAADRGRQRIWILRDPARDHDRLCAEMELWGTQAWVLPPLPDPVGDGLPADPEATAERHEILDLVARADRCVMICASDAWTSTAPSPAALQNSKIRLATGSRMDPQEWCASLTEHGYERVPTVAARGQFSVRGGMVDWFGWQATLPLRIEFFDDVIESIREFDLDSQSSVARVASADVLLAEPAADATLTDYRRDGDLVISIDNESVAADVFLHSDSRPEAVGIEPLLECIASPVGVFDAGDFVLDEVRRENFFRRLNKWKRDGWEVRMVFSNPGEEERFEELLGSRLARDFGLVPMLGELMAGFTIPVLRSAVLSSAELFGRYRTPRATRRGMSRRIQAARAIAAAEEMEDGDLVVHYEYGVARFRGIHDGDDGEELVLEYRDGAILGVPLEQAHLVGRYVGMGGKTPPLNKLGSSAWRNARRAAEKSILDYASTLLRVQAEREHQPGHAHPPDNTWMQEFEHSFHFRETPDQLRAIEETKQDLESPRPMDRLICGDVGFGKTEVAIRAVFKAVTGGKQAAVLVPTTVLAEQHWRTFRERMSDYPLRIELLNRFRTPSETRDVVHGLADGSVDIVIGTHRLVSGDVSFKNLGLVVIDEEQRFGVAHKERFKQLFRQIDVLTLSATPIPRTLYMALMGARDMSTIDTPPPNRMPVTTTVCAYDERVIRDAIRRELARGGQVFFLHNRVRTITGMADRLRELVPEARVVVGHGQMDKDELEDVMHTFVNGNADVLLSTTIIETGIDIPNANTILIDRADRFGLADLYQLRGRVGRTGIQAYAILLLPRDLMTTGDARKRIHAIKEYTALGSGFRIAMRDLEIRGAGSLLGTRQSGHIAQIGFDLYCQLLRQSVDRLKGRGGSTRTPATFRADFLVQTEAAWMRSSEAGKLPAFLPASWLDETTLRIAAYRELSNAAIEKDIDALEASWRDRHGRIPGPAMNLLRLARIKALAGNHGIASVEIQGERLMLQRNGQPILLEGRRFPRLKKESPEGKLAETIELLRMF